MRIASRVLLRLEERVKVPKAAKYRNLVIQNIAVHRKLNGL